MYIVSYYEDTIWVNLKRYRVRVWDVYHRTPSIGLEVSLRYIFQCYKTVSPLKYLR